MIESFWVIGKSWEVGRCLNLGCWTGAGHCLPGCVWYLWDVSASVGCWLFKGFISNLWNEAIRFDLLQFKLNSHLN